MTWKVSKGKDGQPFAVSLSTYIQPNQPLFTDLQVELLRRFGACVLYRLRTHGFKNSWVRFCVFRVCPWLTASQTSIRHTVSDGFKVSVADTLNLGDADRNCLGDWQDGQRLPLNVRYSSERLETAARVRRLCLVALHHLLKHDENPCLLKLRGVLSHVPRLRELANSSQSWGRGVERLPEPSSSSQSPTDRATDSKDSSAPCSDIISP